MSILEARNVTKKFGNIVAIQDFSLSVPASTILGLIGPNGSGKTTFIDLATGFLPPDGGHVFFDGTRTTGRRPDQISRMGIGRTFQETRVFRRMTAIENLVVASRQRISPRTIRRAQDLLGMVGLADLANEYSGNLSYGQQKLLEFARILVRDPRLIFLDEPTAGISPLLVGQLLDCFRTLRDQGKTLIIVEHNMDVINAVCERTLVLDHGRMIAEGSPSEIRQNAMVQDAYLGRAHGDA